MLTQTKISFAIKFSTYSKDVSMTVLDGRELDFQNHAQHHFKTGYTEKRAPSSKKMMSDAQSIGQMMQSDYTSTIKGSVAALSKQTKQSKKPDIKVKK